MELAIPVPAEQDARQTEVDRGAVVIDRWALSGVGGNRQRSICSSAVDCGAKLRLWLTSKTDGAYAAVAQCRRGKRGCGLLSFN